jgi:hypothetical protein
VLLFPLGFVVSPVFSVADQHVKGKIEEDMSGHSVRLPMGTSDLFDDLPKGAKSFLREGFNVVARIQPQHLRLIAAVVVAGLTSGAEPKAGDLSAQFGLNEADAQSLLGAIGFISLILSKPGEPEPTTNVVNGLLSAEVLDRAAQESVTTILRELDSDRPTIKAALRRSNLASLLLPALTDLSFVVDLRIDFDGDQVASTVPVLVVHIETDARDHEISFQMSRGQLEAAIEDLSRALARLQSAEKWAQRKSV